MASQGRGHHVDDSQLVRGLSIRSHQVFEDVECLMFLKTRVFVLTLDDCALTDKVKLKSHVPRRRREPLTFGQ